MKYSVVICSYNKLESLKRVVSAILATGVECEIILSDDGSDDGTIDWAHECGLFETVLESDESKEYRLNTVRNRGVEAATCSKVVLLDADCVPQIDFFDGHDDIFEKYPKSISVGFTRLYDELGEKFIGEDHRYRGIKKSGEKRCPVTWMDSYGGNIAFPKSLWEKVGGFDEMYNGAWGLEDADFAYMATKAGFGIWANIKTVARHLRHPATGTAEMRSGKGPNTKKFKDKHGFSPC